jgi:hypothetical protein
MVAMVATVEMGASIKLAGNNGSVTSGFYSQMW